jgi:hypothetical protein
MFRRINGVCIGFFFLLVLNGCAETYDENALLKVHESEKCMDSRYMNEYSDSTYEQKCEGKSVKLDAFIIEREEKDSYTMKLTGYPEHEFLVELTSSQKAWDEDEKVEVSGVIGGRSWTGLGTIENAVVIFALRSEEEQRKQDVEIKLKEIKEAQQEIFAATLYCADAFELTKPGTSCPRPSFDDYVSGQIGPDGEVTVEGVCYFGVRPITFSCVEKYGRAEIVDYEIRE